MSMLLPFFSCYMAMSVLTLSFFRYFKTVLQKVPLQSEQRWLSVTGWLLLAGSGWLCMLIDGVGYGLVVLLGLVSVSTLLIMMLLSLKPALLPVSMLFVLIGGLWPLFG